ncbi:enhanced serine sensitivity protein SseB C-terminal domain-containing protein [Streptomyces litchfieldiae]|uniref:Enhanced serine sensitivity protein SseB C-terminal domain-containing protein n=1 Tax=Streptomyces litchfieldiae TaxID=3075543 RepID=A0ABU2MI46_9ACTN|nr:enhanced serine sensitivity protein SseB C-terminal domain-containing protein [Streptomyces sp. DSM 44938]MDT0341253.1 enhanced serine sensitivity protein SseB C-terminal domain-containing protein [Streptomyces sp. DSM 44938]
MSAGEGLEELLPRITPDRLDTYEELLAALAASEVWMLLWHGRPGDPEAQYGSVEVAGHGYAPCVTSERELSASGWTRSHEVVTGRDIAAALYPDHWGLWLNPHAPGGGLGIPWLDLRRIAGGLERLPAGPLRISEPSIRADEFYARLIAHARRTPMLRSLRRAWVRPAVGQAYLVIGLDVDDPGERTAEAVREMMRQVIAAVPDGLPVGTVAMADAFDPVAMWLRANTRSFYDRDATVRTDPDSGRQNRHGYGYPRPY